MASTSTAPPGTPTSAEFAGDNFSNNLFSDLAPLLTLFGEQVTKQFLSLTLGWADHILLAMGPLGIITIVVSAIRVSGPKKLKAMIGRARESSTTAEVELLSSTSHDVCELWDGNQIVRVIGRPKYMKDLVFLKSSNNAEEDDRILDLKDAVASRLLVDVQLRKLDWKSQKQSIAKKLENLSTHVPNITLNVAGATISNLELWLWVAIGLALQTAALIVPGLTVYLWKWQKGEQDVATYGYPCLLSGSLAIIMGVLGCSYVIDKRTEETTFRPGEAGCIQNILRVQQACTVGDQRFQSYAIINEPSNCTLRISRLRDKHGAVWSLLTTASTTMAVVGYIIQFVGFRALHWSATIIQLGTTLAMTGCRAWVRRGLAVQPTCVLLQEAREAAWLTLFVLTYDSSGETRKRYVEQDLLYIRAFELYTGYRCIFSSVDRQSKSHPMIRTGPYKTNKAVKLHQKHLRVLKQPPIRCEWSGRLCSAVEGIMKHIMSTDDILLNPNGGIANKNTLSWTVAIAHGELDTEYINNPKLDDLTIGVAFKRDGHVNGYQGDSMAWMVDADEINSVIEILALSLDKRLHAQWRCSLSTCFLFRTFSPSTLSYFHYLGSLNISGNEINSVEDWIDTSYSNPPIFNCWTTRCLRDDIPVEPFETYHLYGVDSPFLVAISVSSVRHVCALELLRLFLLAIFSEILQIQGKTRRIPNGRHKPENLHGDKPPTEPLWKNTAIDAISACIVEAGLVGTLVEANNFVIPALYDYDLLPRKSSNLSPRERFLERKSQGNLLHRRSTSDLSCTCHPQRMSENTWREFSGGENSPKACREAPF